MKRWYWVLEWAVMVSLGVLAVKACELMVIKGKYYRSLANNNRISEIKIEPERGRIVDRKGRVVAEDKFSYRNGKTKLEVWQEPGEFEGWEFSQLEPDFKNVRYYPYGVSLGSVTGWKGKSGVEKVMDKELTGVAGKRLVEVDSMGKYIRELGRLLPSKGIDVKLSIDAYWQDKLYKLMEGKAGAAVVSYPDTGEVVALVSSPSYDPNVFTNIGDNNKIFEYINDSINLPLLNRAIGAKYHPGSTFKLTVSIAGLESNKLDPNQVVEDTGFLMIGNYKYTNWLWNKRGGTDGFVDLVTALKRSNDIYFYKAGEIIGPKTISDWAYKLGLGETVGIELPSEVGGLIPDPDWKKEAKGEGWFTGNTYHMAIGQGDVATTPLQVNMVTGIIATGGIKCRPTIMSGTSGNCVDLKLKPENLEIIKRGMRAACQTGGTAWPLFNFKTTIACKTGTAEVGGNSTETHAWLTAFAPADNPEIAVTVLLERGGEGSDAAAPIVGDFLKEWFDETDTLVPRLTTKPIKNETNI
ncbi:MAG: penicillin-binding transpeptidase domain-containing protein [Candidatus Shapirobacteria bacterium]